MTAMSNNWGRVCVQDTPLLGKLEPLTTNKVQVSAYSCEEPESRPGSDPKTCLAQRLLP